MDWYLGLGRYMPDFWDLFPFITLVIGVFWLLFPPRTRNGWVFGKQNRRAVLSQETWDYANRAAATRIILGSLVLGLVRVAGHLHFPGRMLLVTVIGVVAIGVFIDVSVRIGLRKRFDDQGQPRVDCPSK